MKAKEQPAAAEEVPLAIPVAKPVFSSKPVQDAVRAATSTADGRKSVLASAEGLVQQLRALHAHHPDKRVLDFKLDGYLKVLQGE